MVNLLLLNVGSSSIKYKVASDAKTLVEGKHAGLNTSREYQVALRQIESMLAGKKIKVDYVVHRVVHGFGLHDTCFYNKNVREHIEKGIMAAPLHNKPQLAALKHFEGRLKQVCVFDSLPFSFDDINASYALPMEIAEELGIKRVGFHGLSHKFMYEYFEKKMQLKKKKVITVHLGSGSSVSSFVNGKAVYNSMGFTPLSGIIMSTRSGDIDPGIIFYLNDMGMPPAQVFDMFNYESGMKGLTGEKDFLKILKSRKRGNKYDFAYKMFVQSVCDNIAQAVSRINGCDAILFSGEIGSGSETVRNDVKEGLSFFGKSVKYSNVKADEESVMLKEAQKIIGRSPKRTADKKSPAKSEASSKSKSTTKKKTVEKKRPATKKSPAKKKIVIKGKSTARKK